MIGRQSAARNFDTPEVKTVCNALPLCERSSFDEKLCTERVPREMNDEHRLTSARVDSLNGRLNRFSSRKHFPDLPSAGVRITHAVMRTLSDSLSIGFLSKRTRRENGAVCSCLIKNGYSVCLHKETKSIRTADEFLRSTCRDPR